MLTKNNAAGRNNLSDAANFPDDIAKACDENGFSAEITQVPVIKSAARENVASFRDGEKKFTQEELEKLISERLKRERKNNAAISALKKTLDVMSDSGFIKSGSYSLMAEELTRLLRQNLAQNHISAAPSAMVSVNPDGHNFITDHDSEKNDGRVPDNDEPEQNPHGNELKHVPDNKMYTEKADSIIETNGMIFENSGTTNENAGTALDNAVTTLENCVTTLGNANTPLENEDIKGTKVPASSGIVPESVGEHAGARTFSPEIFGVLYELKERFPENDVAHDVTSKEFELFAKGKSADISEIYKDFLCFKAQYSDNNTRFPSNTVRASEPVLSRKDIPASDKNSYEFDGTSRGYSGFSGGAPLADYSKMLTKRQMDIAKQSGMSYREYANLLQSIPQNPLSKGI